MGKHYVPQRYLRGFATGEDDSQIWQYDRAETQWARAAIKRVAQERDYFDEATEREIAQLVETPGNVALEKLRRSVALPENERLQLALYISSMIERVPASRARQHAMIPAVLEGVVADLKDGIREAATRVQVEPERLRWLLTEADRLRDKYAEDAPEAVVARIRSPWPTEQLFTLVARMTWRLLAAPTPQLRFVTSDNPAYFFGAWGLGREHSEFTFPVSSSLALLGSWQGSEGSTISVTGKPNAVREVNRRMIAGAHRFIYSARREEWIERLAAKRDPCGSRFNWQS